MSGKTAAFVGKRSHFSCLRNHERRGTATPSMTMMGGYEPAEVSHLRNSEPVKSTAVVARSGTVIRDAPWLHAELDIDPLPDGYRVELIECT